MGAYDCDDGRLVGTSCSAPITCVSNNDVPKKAPYIPIDIPVASAWPKWHYCPTQVLFSLPKFFCVNMLNVWRPLCAMSICPLSWNCEALCT